MVAWLLAPQRWRAQLVLGVAALLLCLPPSSAHAAEQVKIAVVDMNKIVNEVIKNTPEYRDYRNEIEKRELEIERRRQEIQRLQKDVDDNKHLWPESKVEEARQELREKRADARYYAETVQRFAEVEQQKMLRREMPDVRTSIEAYGTREGYSLILERGTLYFANDALDITEELIKVLTQ